MDNLAKILNSKPRIISPLGLDLVKYTFMEDGMGLVIGTLPVSFRSKNVELKEKTRREITERLSKGQTKRSLEKYFKGEIKIRLTCYFNRRYATTDVDNIAKFTLDCMKGLAFKDDKQIKELMIRKIKSKKGRNEYIGVKISRA